MEQDKADNITISSTEENSSTSISSTVNKTDDSDSYVPISPTSISGGGVADTDVEIRYGDVDVSSDDWLYYNMTADFGQVPSAAVNVYFSGALFSDAMGIMTIKGFNLNLDTLSFNVSDSYSDASRFQTVYDKTEGVLTVYYLEDDNTLTTIAQFNYTQPADADAPAPNVLTTDNGDGTYKVTLTKCFLTGTNIMTPRGEVLVEDLCEGDEVITLLDGKHVAQRIVWAGNMEVDVSRYENKDALYPVRIKAHAFGLNQPCRDLLITPEHTVYVNGGLIPARMLVNGRSIIIDRSMDCFTVYHIETEDHSIVLSENLTTESYLNTDDRHLFNNGGAINLHLTFDEHAGHKNWVEHAAAPLAVSRDQVEPIWERLNNRATEQGYAKAPKPETTRDPSLCLITQHGDILQPVDVRGHVYSFYVPANVRVVAMRSRSGLPSEVVGPFIDDRRMLGVLVSKISVLGEQSVTVLPSDMSDLSGWHSVETGRDDRWTKGLATLPSEVSTLSQSSRMIRIELTDTAEYLDDDMSFVSKIA